MFIKSSYSNTNAPANTRKNSRKGFVSAKFRKTVTSTKKTSTVTNNYGTPKSNKSTKPIITIAPRKLILWAVITGILGFSYITHVFNTQQILAQVNETRVEYERARIIYDNRALIYHRMTGPAEIYSRAKEQGFIDKDPSDRIIEVRR